MPRYLKYVSNRIQNFTVNNMLIFLYFLAAALVLTGVQPFTTAGVLFGICYLPGLTLFVFFKKDALDIKDLILAFPCSLGISSLFTVGLLYTGVGVQFISYIIYGLNGAALLLYSVNHRKLAQLKIKLTPEEQRFLIVALLMTLVLSIPVLSERIAISAHGFHHSTIATQILNGIFPPENTGLGGTSLSYHWGHHALVAALSFPADFHPLRVISTLNIISLFFTFLIAYRTAKIFGFSEGYSFLVPLALIGLMRSDAVIFFMNKLVSGNLMELAIPDLAEMRPLDILQNWVWGGGAPWFDRRLFFLNKYYNANTMPLGILLCLSYFMLLLIQSERKYEHDNSKCYLIMISLVIIANCFIYPPLAIIMLLHAPLWAGSILLLKQVDFKTKFKESLEILLPYSIAVVTVLPYLLSVSSTSSEPAIKIAFWDQSIRNIIVFWLPAPFILYGVWIAFKENSSRKLLFLLTGTFLCFSLSTFTRVALWNSGKFTFILSFFYALFFVYAISKLLHLFSNRWLKRIITASIILFLFITPILTEISYIVSPWFRDNTYSFSGRHIVFAQDSQRNEAYTWIRNNTASEALIMLTYVETSDPDNIAQNSTYEPAALTERNLFVVKDWYTFPNPEYTKRVSIREKLFLSYSDPDVKSFFATLDRPVYLLVEERLSPVYLKDEIFKKFPDDPEGFMLLYHNENQRVYLLQS